MMKTFFISDYMGPKESIEKRQKIGNHSFLSIISILCYLLFTYEDASIIYLVNAKGPYYDFAYEFYPVSLVRLPICIIGVILLFLSLNKNILKNINKFIIYNIINMIIINFII